MTSSERWSTSDFVGSRNVSEDVVSALRYVHGLFDGGVSTAHLEQAILQRVLTDQHGEKHSHLIIPETEQAAMSQRWQTDEPACSPRWPSAYFAFSCSIVEA